MSVNFKTLSGEISSRYLEIKSGCGANSSGGGGFTAGNTCARGGGSSSSSDGVDFDDPDKKYYYHGTTQEAWDSIQKDGLVPGGKGRTFSNEFYVGDRAVAVYLTTDRMEAASYARNAAEKTGGESLLLKIAIPDDHSKLIKKDKSTGSKSKAVTFSGTVKPEWIKNLNVKAVSNTLYAVIMVTGEKEEKKKK